MKDLKRQPQQAAVYVLLVLDGAWKIYRFMLTETETEHWCYKGHLGLCLFGLNLSILHLMKWSPEIFTYFLFKDNKNSKLLSTLVST